MDEITAYCPQASCGCQGAVVDVRLSVRSCWFAIVSVRLLVCDCPCFTVSVQLLVCDCLCVIVGVPVRQVHGAEIAAGGV